MIAELKGLCFGLFARLHAPMKRSGRAAAAGRAAHRPAFPQPMTAAQQWQKVAGVLSSAIVSATSAKELQAAAAQQIDLATYALYNLFDELTAVMSEHLVREAAVVHRLRPQGQRSGAQPALAA